MNVTLWCFIQTIICLWGNGYYRITVIREIDFSHNTGGVTRVEAWEMDIWKGKRIKVRVSALGFVGETLMAANLVNTTDTLQY